MGKLARISLNFRENTRQLPWGGCKINGRDSIAKRVAVANFAGGVVQKGCLFALQGTTHATSKEEGYDVAAFTVNAQGTVNVGGNRMSSEQARASAVATKGKLSPRSSASSNPPTFAPPRSSSPIAREVHQKKAEKCAISLRHFFSRPIER